MDSVAKACCYMITNDINNKMYIGVTTSFNSRMASHKHSPNTKMKIDIDKYGWDSFSKEVLFYGTEDYCYYMEPILIKEYNSTYNIMIGGKTGSGVSGEDNGNSKFTDIEIKNIIQCKTLSSCDMVSFIILNAHEYRSD